MKKILTGILATIAILACAGACKNNNDSSPSNSTPSVSNSNGNSSSSATEVEDENLQTAAEFLKSKEQNLNKEGREDYTVDAKVWGYPITWTVNVSAGVTFGEVYTDEDGSELIPVIVAKDLKEDLTYTLTATVTNEAGESIVLTFTRKVLAMSDVTPKLITAAPVAGTAYKLYVYQGNNQTDMYFTGAKANTYYFATTENYKEGVDVYVEYLEGSTTEFYPYFFDGTNTKMYIGVVESWNSTKNSWSYNPEFSGNPVSKFVWNSEYNTITTTIAAHSTNDQSSTTDTEKTLYLGSYDTKNTISSSLLSYASKSFVGGLAEMISADSVSAETKFAAIKEVLSVQAKYTLDQTVELTAYDERYPDVKIAWTSSDEACAKVDGSALKLTIPEAQTTVTLTATLTCGEKTDTKTFTLTLGPKTVAPAANASASEIVNAAFNLAAGETLGEYTLTGKITNVNTPYSSEYSNVTVTIDVEGKSIQCYRLKGTGADAIKIGDTITVTGTLMNFKGTVEFGSGCSLDSYTEGEGGSTGGDSGETTDLDITKGFTIADWADANNWEDSKSYTTITNKGVTLTVSGTAVGDYSLNTGKYYTNGEDWRIYQTESATLTISVASGSIGSVKITYAVKNTGILTCGETQIASDEVYTVNASSVTFGVGNTGDEKKGQVKITAIQVTLGEGSTGGDTTGGDEGNTGDNTDTKTYSVVTAPVVGTAYKFGMVQSGKTYYLTGAMVNTYYFATTDTVADALDFYLEQTEGGYYLYCTMEQKTYVNIVTSDTYVNVKYQITASTVYTIDSETGELRTTVNDTAYTIGTYGTYTSVSPVKASENIHCNFYAESTTDSGNQGGSESGDNTDTPVTPTEYTTLTIPEAIEKANTFSKDNYTTEKYYISGTIVKLASTTYGNCYIADENGNIFYVYGLYDENNTRYDSMATKPVVGDTVKLLTVIGKYTDVRAKNATVIECTANETIAPIYKLVIESFSLTLNTEIKAAGDETVAIAGTTYTDVAISYATDKDCAVVDNANGKITYTLPEELTFVTITATLKLGETSFSKTFSVKVSAAPKADEETVTLSFADKTNRKSQDSNSQVWTYGAVTLTNNKSASKTDVADAYNPVKCYASSQIIIDCKGMTQIVFNCNNSSYATELKDSITESDDYDFELNGSVVTVTFTASVDKFEIAKLKAQVRLNSIEVTYSTATTTETNE